MSNRIKFAAVSLLALSLTFPARAQISSTTLIGGTTPVSGVCTNGQVLFNNAGVLGCQSGGGGSGTVTSVGETFTGGLISVAGSPITTAGTFALTVAGTSGGIPYFASSSTWASSAALAANALVIGGGAGAAPASTTTGTGVVTALGIAVNTTGGIATYPASGAGVTLTVGSTTTSGGGAGQIMFDSGPGTFQEATGITATNTTLTVSGGSLILSGNQSAAAWTTNGLRLKGVSGTLTDTSSSGTVVAQYTDVLGGNTIAASSATTYTKYASLHLNAPVAGTNVTFTSNPALDVAGANNSYAAIIAGGSVTGSGTNGVGLNITGTMNTSGVVDGALISGNATGTAFPALSTLVNLKIDGVTQFAVGVDGTDTSHGTLWLPNGTPSNLNYTLGNLSGSLYINAPLSNSNMNFALAAITHMNLNPTPLSFRFDNNLSLAWTSGAVGSTSSDTFLTRKAAATLQLGAADAAATVAQTLGVQSVVAGTSNTAGSAWTLTGSLSTGTGTSGDIILKTGATGTTGTVQNAATTALTIKGATQRVVAATTIATGGYTVSTLPTGVVGDRAYVTDQTAACVAVGAALTGGGAITCPTFYNGSAWVGG